MELAPAFTGEQHDQHRAAALAGGSKRCSSARMEEPYTSSNSA
jgi:hypothetical protein